MKSKTAPNFYAVYFKKGLLKKERIFSDYLNSIQDLL